jgi:hypothetical protein
LKDAQLARPFRYKGRAAARVAKLSAEYRVTMTLPHSGRFPGE